MPIEPMSDELLKQAREDVEGDLGLSLVEAESLLARLDLAEARSCTPEEREILNDIYKEEPEVAADISSFWGFYTHWNEVLKCFKNENAGYGESPTELIFQVINERDDLRTRVRELEAKLLKTADGVWVGIGSIVYFSGREYRISDVAWIDGETFVPVDIAYSTLEAAIAARKDRSL